MRFYRKTESDVGFGAGAPRQKLLNTGPTEFSYLLLTICLSIYNFTCLFISAIKKEKKNDWVSAPFLSAIFHISVLNGMFWFECLSYSIRFRPYLFLHSTNLITFFPLHLPFFSVVPTPISFNILPFLLLFFFSLSIR